MRLPEFLETYPIDGRVPIIQDSVYGAARRQAHITGLATLNAIQGLPLTATQEDALRLNNIWDTRDQFHDRAGSPDYDQGEFEMEYTHFSSAVMTALSYEQLRLLIKPDFDSRFDYAHRSAVIAYSLMGVRTAARLEANRQAGIPVRSIMQEEGVHSAIGILNEYETSLVLLGIAKAKRPERNLVILPAPPQVEWYRSDKRSDKSNHADLLVIDITDPENKKIAPIQVKSSVPEAEAQKYNGDTVILICGQSDLDNRIQEDGRTYSWPGRFAIQRSAELLLQPKRLMHAISQGHIDNNFALNTSARNRHVIEKVKRRNINYKEVYARIWPRIERSLDS